MTLSSLARRLVPVCSLLAAMAWPALTVAKLPPPTPEAKAKADEAKLKTAHADKVAAFQLCKSQNHAADNHRATLKAAGKEAKAAVETPACVDPGAFDLAAAQAAATAAAAAAASAPAPVAAASAPAAAK